MRIIGFTGTQEGLSQIQRASLTVLLGSAGTFHHGDCVGADAEAHSIAARLDLRLISHPPTIQTKRAFTTNQETRVEKPYLERNRAIVDESNFIIACPKGPEELRSGTWSTVRYAKNQEKRGAIIFPDGRIQTIHDPENLCLFFKFS